MNQPVSATAVVAVSASTVAMVALGLVILAGGSDLPTASSDILRPGTVPPAYAPLVAAGNQCPAAPAPVIAAQLEAESGFDPSAVSPAGAQGIAQFMPDTWARWGRDENHDDAADPYDPADAIPAQARYDCALAAEMAPAVARGTIAGDQTDLMLAAYNAGPGAVTAAGGIPQNGETPDYVTRIRARAAAYAATADSAGPVGGSLGARTVAAALAWVDRVPYVWGGGGPQGPTAGQSPGIGFDCSGLVLYAVYQASDGRLTLPHLADAQARLGHPIARTDLRPGDLIAFADPGSGTYHHIGIYLGGNQLVHAPDFGQSVTVTTLTGAYWATQTWRAVRLG